MRLAYPVTLKTYESGQIGATFKDVPEAMTCADTMEQVLELAKDALITALFAYQNARRRIPKPSPPKPGEHLVFLPLRVALKIAIYNEMISRHMTQQQLADLLKCDGRQVRRLLDLDHESKLSQLEAAFNVLGLQPTEFRYAGKRSAAA